MSDVTKAEIEAAMTNMRELARNPAKLAEMTAAWNQACDRLEAHYRAMRPKPKVFEVHHMNVVARHRFACAIAAGHPMAECANLAIAKITGTRAPCPATIPAAPSACAGSPRNNWNPPK